MTRTDIPLQWDFAVVAGDLTQGWSNAGYLPYLALGVIIAWAALVQVPPGLRPECHHTPSLQTQPLQCVSPTLLTQKGQNGCPSLTLLSSLKLHSASGSRPLPGGRSVTFLRHLRCPHRLNGFGIWDLTCHWFQLGVGLCSIRFLDSPEWSR